MSDPAQTKGSTKSTTHVTPAPEPMEPLREPSERDISAFEQHCTTLVTTQSVLARAATLRAAYKLWEEVKGHYGRGSAPGKSGGGKTKTDTVSFHRHVARLLCCSEKTIHRYVRIGERFTAEQVSRLYANRHGISNEFCILHRMAELDDDKMRESVISEAVAGLAEARALLDKLAPRATSKPSVEGEQAPIEVTLDGEASKPVSILGTEFLARIVANDDGTYILQLIRASVKPASKGELENLPAPHVIDDHSRLELTDLAPLIVVQDVLPEIAGNGIDGSDGSSAQLKLTDVQEASNTDLTAERKMEEAKEETSVKVSPSTAVTVPQTAGAGPNWELLRTVQTEILKEALPRMENGRDRFKSLVLPTGLNPRDTVYGTQLASVVSLSLNRSATTATTQAKKHGLARMQDESKATPGATLLVVFADNGCVSRFFGVGQVTQDGALPRDLTFVAMDSMKQYVIFRGPRKTTSLGDVHSIWTTVPESIDASKAAE